MKDLVVLSIKMLAGGTLVVVFSVVAEVLKPKSFSGLFGGSLVALASLLVTGLAASPAKAALASNGMIAGAVG